jgi:hypothetical protein
MGKPPGKGNSKSRPVVVEGERRKNRGVVNVRMLSLPTGFVAAQKSNWSNGLLGFNLAQLFPPLSIVFNHLIPIS